MWAEIAKLLSEDKLIAGVLLALLGFAGSSQALLVWLVRRTANSLDGFREEIKTHNQLSRTTTDQNTAAMAVMNHNVDDLLDAISKCSGPRGETGDTGPRGRRGEKGETGDRGPRGGQ